ncbi:ABC transporter ATP-binding protein [Denitrobaculum tricleocarpae]|uniref:ABC transporter ATP-binding protein n=1 Tax=Denitrobaculum tricleocarpae TaxID=2591009 RepID=A0A545TEM9_9PROT|nr:ABC transporter ATP-binding protein [Denitrobaculum tricleocarpae]TQV75677.1 ABC transporter ATP-binding protein [Denitrobaculum tricleocarpae]
MAEIALQAISKSFGSTRAVKDLDLTVRDGEFVVLLGPTGAGKTTTLRLIAGLEKPEAGRVSIDAMDVTETPTSARNVAFVFQQYSLYPHYSVLENLAFPLKAPGQDLSAEEIEARVREIAELLRIDHKLENRATALSGGEMQRVAIGRALVRNPTVFLMDEPLSSLDAKLREDLRVELKRIQRDLGATIVYVTHDQLEAMTLADRIGVLDEGELVQIGDPREVYETPASVYVAQRLGSPQINLLAVGMLDLPSVPPSATTLGVRPEDIVLDQGEGALARVINVEHLGVETVILLELAGQHLHALLGDAASLEEGAEISISVREGAALFFDTNGKRVDLVTASAREEAVYGT